jgi:hypothetical protein
MAVEHKQWHEEPWIRTISLDEFIKWGRKNTQHTDEELSEIYGVEEKDAEPLQEVKQPPVVPDDIDAE